MSTDQQAAGNTVVSVTRQQLYDRIWAEPVSVVCRELGISNVGLAKLCARWDLPRPPRGHWAQKWSGQSVRQVKLKAVAEGDPVALEYRPAEVQQTDPEQAPRESDRQREFEGREANSISVPEQLTEPHALVARTEKSIRSTKPGERGLVQPKAQGCLDVTVSPTHIDRAMRVLNAIVTALESREMPVTITDGDSRRTQTTVLGESIGFRLSEGSKRREREPTAKEKAEDARWAGFVHLGPPKRYEWVPTGVLSLEITDGSGVRRRWSDSAGRLVEACLNQFVVGLVRASESVKRERAEMERRKEWAEQERRRREAERLRQEEEARCRDLDAQIAAWAKADKIRAYAAALRQAADRRHGAVTPGSELDRWLTWIARRANGIDPVAAVVEKISNDSQPTDRPTVSEGATPDTAKATPAT
jgi:hypothetical protein